MIVVMKFRQDIPIILLCILNIVLYFNIDYIIILLLLYLTFGIVDSLNIQFDIISVFIIFVIIFSILHWLLKPFILEAFYNLIRKKYPCSSATKFFNKLNINSSRNILIFFLLEVILIFVIYCIYLILGNDKPLRNALLIYLFIGGGLLHSYLYLLKIKKY